MSSILKALEKVEQERNARHEGPLGRFHKESERRRPWVIPVCVVSGAAAAALITFAAMGGFSGKAPAKAQVAQAPAPVQVQAPPSAPAAAVAPVAAPAAAPTAAPAAKAAAVPAATPVQAALPVEVVASPAVRTEGTLPHQGARNAVTAAKAAPAVSRQQRGAKGAPRSAATGSEKKGAVAATIRHNAPGTSAAAAPAVALPAEAPAAQPAASAQAQPAAGGHQAIRVTGIAWQKDAGTSVAMVNGRQVYEGETVEGARVKEIMQDRVRFSTAGGGVFEVPLGAGQ